MVADTIRELVTKRGMARRAGRYDDADRIREELAAQQIVLRDRRSGDVLVLRRLPDGISTTYICTVEAPD